ncbi:MAG: hypothetical protein ABIC91_00375 [Nanoarchaeota archaeon]|nr:hypothetical protein [Nanoarchaeota archaeon]MBU1030581.1 hypothetical protein [Nanoarchaeota archaeon]MBU1849130.1 hypothetical protein [Nanoarchaeota archaeon]
MQQLKILNSKETKRILKHLEMQFGFCEKPHLVFMINSKDKIYVINRDVEKIDLSVLRIDCLGLYFGTVCIDGVRLSIEGSQIIGPKSNKNILKLSKQDFEKWLKGEDFEIDTKLSGFVLIKHEKDFIGCGKAKNGLLMNFVPKSRRLKVVNN